MACGYGLSSETECGKGADAGRGESEQGQGGTAKEKKGMQHDLMKHVAAA